MAFAEQPSTFRGILVRSLFGKNCHSNFFPKRILEPLFHGIKDVEATKMWTTVREHTFDNVDTIQPGSLKSANLENKLHNATDRDACVLNIYLKRFVVTGAMNVHVQAIGLTPNR